MNTNSATRARKSNRHGKTYAQMHEFAETLRRDVRDLRPRDMIDVQAFIWVRGSDEY